MRYYNIVIANATTGQQVKRYTSLLANGSPDPGALLVELDIPQVTYDVVAVGGFVRIWGIPISDINQAANLTLMNITVSAGMSKGLPLANPAQAGIVAQGQIYQAFGNWIGTDQTLDLYFGPPTGTMAAPANLVVNWATGIPHKPAIEQTLSIAFPTSSRPAGHLLRAVLLPPISGRDCLCLARGNPL